MYCNNCGAELKDDMKFCNKCGNKTSTFKRKRAIIFIIILVICLIIGAIAITNIDTLKSIIIKGNAVVVLKDNHTRRVNISKEELKEKVRIARSEIMSNYNGKAGDVCSIYAIYNYKTNTIERVRIIVEYKGGVRIYPQKGTSYIAYNVMGSIDKFGKYQDENITGDNLVSMYSISNLGENEGLLLKENNPILSDILNEINEK